MRNARPNIFWIMGLVFVLICLPLIRPVAASDIKSISVVMDDNYPPYEFRDTQFDPVLIELFIQKVINPTPDF